MDSIVYVFVVAHEVSTKATAAAKENVVLFIGEILTVNLVLIAGVINVKWSI